MTIRIKKPVSFKRNQKITAKNVLRYEPSYLFRNNEVGVWYDPSDMSTMYQDATSSIPVTSVEQPVGLILDKSARLMLGMELISNPGNPFINTTGYIVQGGTFTIVNDRLRASMAARGSLGYIGPFTTVIGKTYYFECGGLLSTDMAIFKADTGTGNDNPVYPSLINGVYQARFRATSNTTFIRFYANVAASVDVDYISVREITGNHAYQTTSASRPVLSARYNLLTYTEDFTAWNKTGSNIIPNDTLAPNGTLTADKLVETNTFNWHFVSQSIGMGAVAHTASCHMKAAEFSTGSIFLTQSGNFGAVFDLANGTVVSVSGTGNTASIENVGNGWYRCSVTNNGSADMFDQVRFGTRDSALTGSQGTEGSGIYIWGADLRPTNEASTLPPYQRVGKVADLRPTNEASTLPPYQRVGNPTAGSSTTAGVADYDTVGFPPYLRFDGVDDFLVTDTINPGAVDKAQVFAGLRKLSDTTTGFICNFGNPYNSNSGSFTIAGPRESNVEFGGTVFAGVYNNYSIDNSTYSAPITVFNTTTMDISNDVIELRINGRLAVKTSNDSGTNNFSSYRFYIGRLEGALLPFNGRIYSLVLRFSSTNLDTNRLLNTEKWVSGKTGLPYTVNIDRALSEILFDRSENTIEDVSNSTIVSKR